MEAVELSDSYFQHSFKKHLGVTPQQYGRTVLAERGRDAIAKARSVIESNGAMNKSCPMSIGVTCTYSRVQGRGLASEYIHSHSEDSITTPQLAKMANLSVSQFERRFKNKRRA